MTSKKINDFHELNFLKLKPRDATYPWKPIKYEDLADIYSFIDFSDSGYETFSPEDAISSPCKVACNILDRIVEFEISLSPVEPGISKEQAKMYTELKKEVSQEDKAILLKILSHKADVLKKIKDTYSNLPQKKGEIKIVALSLYLGLQTEGRIDYINKDLKIINDDFAKMIKKIKHRVIYDRIAGYIRLNMINEKFTPYVHVIFFIKDGVISHSVIKEIVDVWTSFTPGDCKFEAEVSAFDFDFLLAFQHEINETSCTSENETKVQFRFSDVLCPFPYVNGRCRSKFASKLSDVHCGDGKNRRTKSSCQLEQERADKIKKIQKELGYKKSMDIPSFHMAYFLRIAKKINIIPNTRTFDCSRQSSVKKEESMD